jgi:hypothetical protein
MYIEYQRRKFIYTHTHTDRQTDRQTHRHTDRKKFLSFLK